MRLVISPFTTIEENLSLELLLMNGDEDFLILSKNKKSVVIGRNQVPYAEIAIRQQHLNNLSIIRRYSGGGAIFLDEGILNYSFIKNYSDRGNSYAYFNNEVIHVMRKLGIKDLIEKACNIYFKEYKISGTSQYKRKNRILHHGTLLINADLKLLRSIFLQSENYITKAKKSQLSKTININDIFSDEEMDKLEDRIVDIYENDLGYKRFYLTDNIHDEVKKRKEEFKEISWSIGQSPDYEYTNTVFFPDGRNFKVYFEVKKGKVMKQEIENSACIGNANFQGCYHCLETFFPIINDILDEDLEKDEVENICYQFFQ
jgi:lipoate---protein ligase